MTKEPTTVPTLPRIDLEVIGKQLARHYPLELYPPGKMAIQMMRLRAMDGVGVK